MVFTGAVDSQADVLALTRQGDGLPQLRFAGISSGSLMLQDGRWRLRACTEDLDADPQLMRDLLPELPQDTLMFRQA